MSNKTGLGIGGTTRLWVALGTVRASKDGAMESELQSSRNRLIPTPTPGFGC